MPDIKFDISKIFESKHFFPLITAFTIGMIIYCFFLKEWQYFALWFGVSFVIIECLFKLFLIVKGSIIRKRRQKENVIYFAIEAQSFFNSMTEEQIKMAVAVMKSPSHVCNSLSNERFLDSRNPEVQLVLSKYQTLKTSNNKFMWRDDTERFPQSPIIHIFFDPLFYAILDNYSQTGKGEFPKKLKMRKYREYYGDADRFY